jgi:enoyl-CoA hydratase/carnithine racemase
VTDVLVGVQDDDGIRTLTLDSPANRNALSAALLAQLEQALRDATGDPAVRAIVLTGKGTVFCSGADLAERGAAAPNRMPSRSSCGSTAMPAPAVSVSSRQPTWL